MSEKSKDNSRDEPVLTPGGLRAGRQVRRVDPGEVVVRNAAGDYVVRKLERTAPRKEGEGLVLTPGGFRDPSLVHRLAPREGVTRAGGILRKLDLATGLPVEPKAGVTLAAPLLGTGWITDSMFINTTGLPISLFSTTWRVPPPPRTQDNQTIFLFNALQNVPAPPNVDILQPVLQWGKSKAGGGNFWSVSCWFIDASGNTFYHDLVGVSPGDTLVGVIKLTAQSANSFSYDCSFAGIPSVDLTIQNISEQKVAFETLECYRIQQCTDYPAERLTVMGAIELKTGGIDVAPNWTPQNRVTDCGQYTIVVSNASPGGEVALDYGFTLGTAGKVVLGDTSDAAPSLASHNGMLFMTWKGSGSPNLSVMLSADNGKTFGGKMISPEGSDAAPALVSHVGQLNIAWKGSGNDNLSVARVPLVPNAFGSYDIRQLTNKVILGDTSSDGPSLASHNGVLYMAWKGSGNPNLSVMLSMDGGQSWTGKHISPETSDAAPVLVSHDGKLLIAWKGSGNDNLSVAEVGLTPSGNILGLQNRVILGDSSSAAPTLASFEGMLFMGWKGSGNDNLSVMLSVDYGKTFEGKCIFGDTSDTGPSLAAHNGELFLGWKGSGNDNLNVAKIELEGDTTALPFGFSIAIDATRLFIRSFFIFGVTGELTARRVQTVELAPGDYSYQVQSGVLADFTFTVTPRGTVDYDRSCDAFLAGRGTATLQLLGLEVTLDALSLTGADNGGGVLLASVPGITNDDWIARKTVRLLPQEHYMVQQSSGQVARLEFALQRDGLFSYRPELDTAQGGCLAGAGTTTLTFKGHTVSVDATAVSHLLLIWPIRGAKAAQNGKTTVVVLDGVFTLQLDRGITDLVFSVGSTGTVTLDPAMTGRLEVVPGIPPVVRVLPHALDLRQKGPPHQMAGARIARPDRKSSRD